MINRKIVTGFTFFLALFVFAACDSNEDPDEFVEGPLPREVAEEDYTVTDSGLQYFDFVAGEGSEAVTGDTLFVDYTGWLTNGFIFDSSVLIAGRSPIRVIIGTTNVIQGWTEGLQGMREGGQRQLVIPPSLGYGSFGQGAVPPNAVMIFEVEVVSLRNGS